MRILFWCELFRPHIGGVELWSVDLIHALQGRGYEFLAIATHGPIRQPNETEFAGIAVHRFSFHGALLNRDVGLIKSTIEKVAALKKRFRPDMIHINTSQPSVFFHHKTVSAFPCPTLFTVHEPPSLSAGANSLLGRVLEAADGVVAVSSAMHEDVLELAPAVGDKCHIIHNAILPTATGATDIDFEQARLLCLGRLVPEKGFDLALEAFAKVHRRHPNARLIIAGDGPSRGQLERQAASLDVASHVDFLGWVDPDDVNGLIERATLVIIPSRWREPFGLVALQAGEYSRPVVAFAVGGLPDIVINERTGLLVPAEDSTAMAQALSRLLDNPKAAISMGAAGHQRIRDKFDYRRFVSRYQAAYEKVAGAGPSRERPSA